MSVGLSYRLGTVTEKIWIALAWMMPTKLVYWCSIRLMAKATTGKYASQNVPDLKAMDALQRWSAA